MVYIDNIMHLKCSVLIVVLSALISCSIAGRRRVHKSGGKINTDDIKDLYDNDLTEFSADELLNLSTNGEQVSKRKHIDPKRSWVAFTNRLSEKTSDRKKKKKRKRNKKTNNNILLGPPGPAGPPGPQGPPGTGVSKEEILDAVRLLVQEEVERRTKEILKDLSSGNSTLLAAVPSYQADQYTVVPRVHAGFSMKLSKKSRVRRKTLMELKSFQQPFGEGGFHRGDVFNARDGRFYAPRDGLYQFSANLHVRVRTKHRVKDRSRTGDHLRIVMCINSLCQTNTSIESKCSIHGNSTIFTSNVQGILQLKEKQYVSLYVDNSSSWHILVLPGSQFFGLLMGV